MTGRAPDPRAVSPGELDTFRVAVGLSIVAGGLALAAPFLDGLVAALAALAAAGWVSGRARVRRAGGPGVDSARLAALACVAFGAVAFLFLHGSPGAARGLVLGLSWLPLWWLERRESVPIPLSTPGVA